MSVHDVTSSGRVCRKVPESEARIVSASSDVVDKRMSVAFSSGRKAKLEVSVHSVMSCTQGAVAFSSSRKAKLEVSVHAVMSWTKGSALPFYLAGKRSWKCQYMQ